MSADKKGMRRIVRETVVRVKLMGHVKRVSPSTGHLWHDVGVNVRFCFLFEI